MWTLDDALTKMGEIVEKKADEGIVMRNTVIFVGVKYLEWLYFHTIQHAPVYIVM